MFNFLHTCTRRVAITGSSGVYTLNDDTHSAQEGTTITGQFDGVTQPRETDTGEIERRLRGVEQRPMA